MSRRSTALLEPIPVLLYHRIAADASDRFAVSPELFTEHISAIAATGRSAMTIDELADGLRGTRPLPRLPVAITIDDGSEDTPAALTEIVKHQLQATVFVTTGKLDQPGMLTVEQLREVADMDTEIELGAHTVSHPHLDAIKAPDVRDELVESKRALEAILERPITTFAYPHGSYDAGVRTAVIDAGYRSAAAVKNALSHRCDDPWAIARYTVTNATTPARIEEILRGRGAPLAWRRERIRTRAARMARRGRRRISQRVLPRGAATVAPERLPLVTLEGPTAVRSVNIDQEITDFRVPASRSGRPYKSLMVVPRLHGQPLGTLSFDLRDREFVSGERLRSAIWNQTRDRIEAHLDADGILPSAHQCMTADRQCRDTPLRNGPMISVIVTTCADVDATVRCLTGLLATPYEPFEVIVVDNRPSDDRFRAAVAGRFGGDTRVRVIEEPRPGLASARNAGLREAEGDIIAVTDDDVVVDSDWLGRIARRFHDQPNAACVTGLILPAELESVEQALIERFAGFGKGFSRQTFSLDLAEDRDSLFPYAAGQFGSGANTAVRADAIDRLGGYEETLGTGTPARGGEDLDLFIRFLLAGEEIAYEPAALVWHRHPSGAGAPRRQATNYGIGLSAMLTRLWLSGGDRKRMLRALPAGIAHLRSAQSPRDVARGEGVPRSLLRWQRFGLAVGPLAYLRSRRVRSAQSSFAPTWIEEIETSEPYTDRPVPRQGDGKRYSRARILARNGGRPLGFAELKLSTGMLRATRLREAIKEIDPDRSDPATRSGDSVEKLSSTRSLTTSQSRGRQVQPRPDVSVVVCTHDRPDSLRVTLTSLLRTTCSPLEVIVVDNAPSTTGTRTVVTELDDARLRYTVEPVPGLSRARNRGLAEARGDIVAFTDDDVIVDAAWVEAIHRGFTHAPEVACVTGLVAPAELDTPAQEAFESSVGWGTNCTARVVDVSSRPANDGLFPYSTGQFGTGANFALRRELTVLLGGFDEALGAGSASGGGEDLDMFLRVLRHGFKLAYEPAALVWHRHRRDSDGLDAQMFTYGAGLSAYGYKQLLHRETRAEVAARIPRALLRAATLVRGDGQSGRRDRAMLRAQLSGYLWGPILYLRGRREVVARREAGSPS